MSRCGKKTPEKNPHHGQAAAPGFEPGTFRMQNGALRAWPRCSVPETSRSTSSISDYFLGHPSILIGQV
jgi:hypothetical protein